MNAAPKGVASHELREPINLPGPTQEEKAQGGAAGWQKKCSLNYYSCSLSVLNYDHLIRNTLACSHALWFSYGH